MNRRGFLASLLALVTGKSLEKALPPAVVPVPISFPKIVTSGWANGSPLKRGDQITMSVRYLPNSNRLDVLYGFGEIRPEMHCVIVGVVESDDAGRIKRRKFDPARLAV